MAIKVRGVRQTIDSLDEIIKDIQGKRAVRALKASMIVGASQAAMYTPIDTGTLINSQFREIKLNGTRITGYVGYSANYAAYVADPNNPMTFRRKTAEKDFLNKGFEDTRALRLGIIEKELKS